MRRLLPRVSGPRQVVQKRPVQAVMRVAVTWPLMRKRNSLAPARCTSGRQGPAHQPPCNYQPLRKSCTTAYEAREPLSLQAILLASPLCPVA
jgi:hypothetical protein